MYDLMEGVRVIEVAEHTFVPAAGVVLADWGADVIKVERSVGGGDPARSLRILQRPGQKLNAYFEVANRGKRSVALDLTRPEGRQALYKLIEGADVFTTNLRADARRKLGIEPEDLMKHNPRLIYARGTGYGVRGAMADHGGFDYPSSWCRSGSGFVQTPADGSRPPQQPGQVATLRSEEHTSELQSRHTRCSRDWSSDVCSSDLIASTLRSARWCSRATPSAP